MKRISPTGFTIVELLIVIVVIAVLAAIAIFGYTGVQARANFSATQQKFNMALKAIKMYHADKGYYPDSENCASGHYHIWCGFSQGTNDGFIPGIVPQYASSVQNLDPSLPDRTGSSGGDTMLYMSRAANGSSAGTAEFNLIRFRNVDGAGLPANEVTNNPILMTTNGYQVGSGGSTVNYGWGYRSNPSLEWF